MKLSGNTVKQAEGSAPQMATYSQQAGFPTIAPAPAQGHVMSTHQGQFQVISSPPFASSGGAQNAAAAAQYIPQFATYNQQGQLVLSPANFPASAYGQQQIILTAAPGMTTNQGQQSQQASAKVQKTGGGGQGQQPLVPMSQPQGGYTLTHNGLVHSNGAPAGTFMFTNPSPLMSQGGLLAASLPTADKGQDKTQGGGGSNQQSQPSSNAGPPLIMHNGMAYSMNPQGHTTQQAILSSNGQIILRAHDNSHQGQQQTQTQQIMFSPLATQQQQQAAQQQQQQMQSPAQSPNTGANLPPPTLQPMSSAASTIRQITVSTASAPPGKTPISRSLPPILPTTRPTYTLPQTPVSQSSLTSGQAPSPKSKNKFSPRGGHVANRGPQPQSHTTSTTAGKVASILKPTIIRGGPPVLSQQQPPVNPGAASQPPTLQPMHTVVSTAPSSAVQSMSSYPPVLAAPSPPTVLVSSASPRVASPKISTAKQALIKAKPAHTPPPVAVISAESPAPSNDTTPKAFVKPNVLTHVIDGHIIQESSQPFPLETTTTANNGSAEDDKGRSRSSTKKEDESPLASSSGPIFSTSGSAPPTTTMAKSLSTTQSSTSTSGNAPYSNQSVEKKRGPGRPPGSTRQNIDSQRIPGSEVKGHIINKDGSGGPCEKRRKLEDPSLLKPIAPATKNNSSTGGGNPLKWSVQQVCDFVKSLHGCAEYVEDFMLQEIDGQALMLLKTEHLMAAMSIKLGPALKICSAINEMREEIKQQV